MITAMARDRVLVIKVVDHNMRTMRFLRPPEKQARAREGAPTPAHRLGMASVMGVGGRSFADPASQEVREIVRWSPVARRPGTPT